MKNKGSVFSRDTIAAIITPPGEGGIGAIRIAGERSFEIIKNIFRPADKKRTAYTLFHLYYGYIINKQGDIIDEVTLVKMPEKRSYTGQKQVEIFCHGSQYVLNRVLEEIYEYKIRPAEPGEFTRRAFLNGRIDLARAEAVAEIISSKTDFAYNAARQNLFGLLTEKVELIRSRIIKILAEIEAGLDYPDEELDFSGRKQLSENVDCIKNEIKELADSYRAGRIIREGFNIAITGRTNAGKSSLFNLFLNQERALVTSAPGTTRDYLTEWIDLNGQAVSISDTAGLRSKAGLVEKAGQELALKILKNAHLVIWMSDISGRSWQKELKRDIKGLPANKTIIVYNKIDKIADFKKRSSAILSTDKNVLSEVALSCKTKAGFKQLKDNIINSISDFMPDLTDSLLVTSKRHQQKLLKASHLLASVKTALHKNQPSELVAVDLRQVINEIDEITGRIYNEEILDDIFSRFCIGK